MICRTLQIFKKYSSFLSWKSDGVFQEPEAVEIDEYQSDNDDDDFRAEVDFDVDIRGADDI